MTIEPITYRYKCDVCQTLRNDVYAVTWVALNHFRLTRDCHRVERHVCRGCALNISEQVAELRLDKDEG
jgi:hypothetical protein